MLCYVMLCCVVLCCVVLCCVMLCHYDKLEIQVKDSSIFMTIPMSLSIYEYGDWFLSIIHLCTLHVRCLSHTNFFHSNFPPTAPSPEERAISDGRIGPQTVGIDKNSLCGTMNIKDGIEVRRKIHRQFMSRRWFTWFFIGDLNHSNDKLQG